MQSISYFTRNSSSVTPSKLQGKTKLSSFDSLLVQTTTKETPMVIVACICCEENCTFEALKLTAKTMSAVYHRLRCRIVDLSWYEDPNFRLSDHVEEITVRPPETITSLLSEYCSEVLPDDRAMWKMTLVHDTFASRDIVVFRSHHAIGDGLSLVQMVDWLFDIETRDVLRGGFDVESGVYSDRDHDVINLRKQLRNGEMSLEEHTADGELSKSATTLSTAGDHTHGHNSPGGPAIAGATAPNLAIALNNSNAAYFRSMTSFSSKQNDACDPSEYSRQGESVREDGNHQQERERRKSRVAHSINSQVSTNSVVPIGCSTDKVEDGDDLESIDEFNKDGLFEVDESGMFQSIKKHKRKKKSSFVVNFFKVLWLIALTPFRLFFILIMKADPPNIFKPEDRGSASHNKRVSMSNPIDLSRIKAVGKAVNGKVNDVIVATTALAIRNFMLAHFNNDESKLPSSVRCILPVSLREPLSRNVDLDNRVSAVFVSLPLKEQNPKTLLRKIKRQMDRLKSYPDVFIVFALITVLVKWLPSEMFIRVQNWFYGKNTLLLSNVPGRKSDAYFAGAKVNDMYFWVPLIGSGALGLSIYSYIDHVVFSCLANPEVLDNPTDLCNEYVKAFNHLERMVLGQNYENKCSIEVRERTSRTLKVSYEEENSLRESKAMAASVNTNACVSRSKAEKKARAKSRGNRSNARRASQTADQNRADGKASPTQVVKEAEDMEKEKKSTGEKNGD